MSKKNLKNFELNDEQLEKVNGGSEWADEMSRFLPGDHGQHIGKYDAQNYIDNKVYVVNDQHAYQYALGRLLDSYEKDEGCGTKRYHKIRILSASSIIAEYTHGVTITSIHLAGVSEFPGDYFTLFLEK